MKVLSAILGGILFVCGIVMLFQPFTSFLSMGILLAIMLTVYGVFGVINGIVKKCFKVNFVFSIIALLLGIFMFVAPQLMIIADGVILIILDIFFIVKGFVEIYTSIVAKASAPHSWGWGLALGIISVLLGIFGLINPLAFALAVGFMLAFFFISTGLNMMSFTAVASVYEDAVEQQQNQEQK